MTQAVVSSILSPLNAIIKAELGLVFSARQDLENFSSAFTAIQAVLQDAEKRQLTDAAAPNDWLAKLKDVDYDVSDLLQEWRERALRFEVDGSGIPTCGEKVWSSSFACLCSNEQADEVYFKLKLGVEMGHTIKNIKERFDVICNEKAKLHFEENGGVVREIEVTSSFVDETEVIGRGPERDMLINRMIGESSQDIRHPRAMFIVGMVGVGKTTVAQLVFNDSRTKEIFSPRIWVHVSDPFDEKKVCISIIEAVEGTPFPDRFQLDVVQNHLRNIVENKRFLLVWDDMWNENRDKWDKVLLPLRVGGRGSQILVTSRNESVFKVIETFYIHRLGPLLEADGLKLFKHIALKGKTSEECLELENDCVKIATECEGVLLVVKTMAIALHSRRRQEWELFFKRENWRSPQNIVLRLVQSYVNMPPHMKQCFSLCFIYPRDHVIEKETLIRLWLSQGFLEEGEDMESVGERCLEDLLRRSLFEEPFPDVHGNIMHYKVKDIVYDFFKRLMDECCILPIGASGTIHDFTRHVSFLYSEGATSVPPILYNKPKKYHSIMLNGCSRIVQLPPDFFESLRYLRALDLSGTKIRELSYSIKKLILLRYLNLSTTEIEELPEAVTTLHLLQTINLNQCRSLRTLPAQMKKLTRLRHLQIEGTESLDFLPDGLGNITCLRTLSRFIVGRNRGCKISELQNLDLLQGALRLERLEEVDNREEACDANLQSKYYLQDLHFCWSNTRKVSGVLTIERVLLNLRPPHLSLKVLTIENFGGYMMPVWIEDRLFSNLIRVTLVSCFACKKLPSLGKLPSLKYLRIEGLLGLENVGREFYGSVEGGDKVFPKLVELTFSDMPIWKGWDMRDGDFPSLQTLEITRCNDLKSLPEALRHLTTLRELKINSCDKLPLEQCRKGGKYWHKIAHITHVSMDGKTIKG